MLEPPTTHITSWSLRRELVGGIEFEVGRLRVPRWVSTRQVQRLLTEHAEYGGWELLRLRKYRDGTRDEWLRRKIIKIRATHLVKP